MKSAYRTTLLGTAGVAGFLIGFGLLSAGTASADEDESPGLLSGLTRSIAAVTDPLLEPLRPITAPLLTPVVRAAQDVPVVPRIAEPLVSQPSVPAEVPLPVPPVAAQPVAVVPVAVVPVAVHPVPDAPVTAREVRAPALPDRVAVPVAPHQVSAPDVVPPVEAPLAPPPDAPFAVPGTPGTASSSGSAGAAVSDLPVSPGVRAHDESLVVSRDGQVHGSWCYYYGRSHPS